MGCSKVKTYCIGQWLYCRSLWSLNWMSNCQPQPFIMSLKWCRSETIHVVHCPKTLISLYSLIMAKKNPLISGALGAPSMCLCRCTLKSRTFCLWAAEIKVFGKKWTKNLDLVVISLGLTQKPWFQRILELINLPIQPVRPEIKVNAQKQVFWPKSRKYQHFEAIHMKSALCITIDD